MWLLESSIYQLMQAAIAAGTGPTAEQQAQFEATHISALSDGGSRILTVAGDSAEISIQGVLTKAPSFLAMIFGGGNTTYPDIISAVHDADANPDVSNIILRIDSPGGSIDGLFEAIDALKKIRKPIKTVGVNLVASAAYGLASVTDTIVATNEATRFGSIGVMGEFELKDDTIKIASTNAPRKAPNLRTEEGIAMVREELDAVHKIFVTAIADGRGGTIDDINANFGQGGVLLAVEALKRGMIDSITVKPVQSVKNINTQTAAIGGDSQKVKVMNLDELKAQHPEAYSAAVDVGVTQGVTQERDRVGAHLTMGAGSPASMVTAIAACKDGTEMTATMTATYIQAQQNNSDIVDGDADEIAAAAAADAANAEAETAGTDAETIAAGLEAKFGTEIKS